MRLKTLLAPLAAATALGAAAAIPAGAHDDHGPVLEDQTSTYEMPCLTVDLRQGRRTPAECADLPHFKASFLNRVWRFKGAVDGFQNTDDHVLSITVETIEGLPRRFRNEDDDLLDQDAYVLMSDHIRVYSPAGELVSHDALASAEYVRVHGRLLRPRKWRANEDDEVVPTMRAKRIYVKDWVNGYEGEGAEEPQPECEPERDPKPEPDAEEPGASEVPDGSNARYATCV